MQVSTAERRRSQRIRVQIPMFLRGIDSAGGEFLDLTKTLDISATGAFLASPRMLKPEHLINLTIPAPSPSSSSGSVPPETPPIQARIRRQEAIGDVHLLAVEFLRTLE